MSDDRPRHLQEAYAAQFQDPSVVDSYGHRPPMPDEVMTVVCGLMGDEPALVLDLGCGQGELSRPLALHAARVDAVDWSSAMVERARALPGGDRPNLRWIVGKAEEAVLSPPYRLVTASQSLQWMNWDILLPRLAKSLGPDGLLVLVDWDVTPPPWDVEARRLVSRLSTNQDFRPFDLVSELVQRRLFMPIGRHDTVPVPFRQGVAEYIESWHARNGLSRDRMTKEAAAAFDRALQALVSPWAQEESLALEIGGQVVWGRPLEGGPRENPGPPPA